MAAQIRRLFWAAAWLAIVLIAIKAYYWAFLAITLTAGQDYLRSLAAISYVDVLFSAVVWAGGRALLALTANRRWPAAVVTVTFTAFAALSCLYAVTNLVVFGVFGGFITYPLLALAGNVRMLSSSVTAQLTPRVVAGAGGAAARVSRARRNDDSVHAAAQRLLCDHGVDSRLPGWASG